MKFEQIYIFLTYRNFLDEWQENVRVYVKGKGVYKGRGIFAKHRNNQRFLLLFCLS